MNFDSNDDRKRNVIECSYCHFKQWRAVGHSLRQARPNLPRRHRPVLRHHLDQGFVRHALALDRQVVRVGKAGRAQHRLLLGYGAHGFESDSDVQSQHAQAGHGCARARGGRGGPGGEHIRFWVKVRFLRGAAAWAVRQVA